MAKKPVVMGGGRQSGKSAEEARRTFGERITEETGEGLIIHRQDGTVQRVGKGGKLETLKDASRG